jgi:ferredoxin
MSKRDGKSVLLGAREMKGQHTLRLPDDTAFEVNQAAARACPVHIIQVRQV